MSVKTRGFDYNFVVIGGGSGGLVAAETGSALKAKVALIEKKRMGGDCLNTGCVPSKTLLRSAKVFALRHKAADLGFSKITLEMDFGQVMQRVKRVIGELSVFQSVEKLHSLGVACYEADARILSPREVVAGGKILRTRSILIATGGRPFLPPIAGLADMAPLTSDTVWGLQSLPRRLLILGGGVIGCELAQAFQRLGSEVTLVERNERLLSREDEEVSTLLQKRFESEGMKFIFGAKAVSFRWENQEKILDVEGAGSFGFDEVLVALGRKPNVENFGLEPLGVKLRPNGAIQTDLAMRTSVRGIYACGDVTGPYHFAHFAELSGKTAAINALAAPFRRKARISVFPWAIYTDPEIGRVGMNETEARQTGIGHRVSHFDFKHSDRAAMEEEREGFVKVITASGSDRILGATVMGPSAGELIHEFSLAMANGIGLRKIGSAIHAYPTLIEANRDAAMAWEGRRDRGLSPSLLLSLNRFWRQFPW